jgi:hypothetical protein
MSERVFALLLRLYPADFRTRYGDEYLQLIAIGHVMKPTHGRASDSGASY